MEIDNLLNQSPLGKRADYCGDYQPALLFPVARAAFRASLGIAEKAPFYGHDLWNSYEFSWLNEKGKPVAAIAQFLIPCHSPYLIESKSFKLYLNSFHQTRFNSLEEISSLLKQDLSECAKAPVLLEVAPMTTIGSCELIKPAGVCLDHLDITVEQYTVDPALLAVDGGAIVTESLYSDLFKSNCLVTGQPDWASIQIEYTGRKINHEQLLKYLISFRQFTAFHEHCVEQAFMEILQQCQPQQLTVTGHYTRRGGLDINACRSTQADIQIDSTRLIRQ